jgi:hypothetical protein
VPKGWAGGEPRDTYEQERRPVAEHDASLDRSERLRAQSSRRLQVDLGGRIPHAWVGSGPERVSTLDLLSPALTLFTTADAPRAQVTGED